LTTKLSSPFLFGIGENGKENFMHDMNYKTWPLFASQNHPITSRDKPNLYSQFPMYLNIEPDGNSHVVVFHNSNPSEFYLTPNPSLTYRSIGGIFDIFIFMGPTPVQALEQFQQAFGMPKLPPLWSLGLQIGAKNYLNSLMMRSFVKSFKDSKLPFDSVFLGVEHLREGSMFTLSNHFWDLNAFVGELRRDRRAIILKWIPAITNTTQNYPFSEGVSRKRYWILENFFSTGVTGKLKGRNVLYPDYTMTKTKEWWQDALQRYIVTDKMITFDGIFVDYLSPLNDKLNETCPNNKWNNPPYLPFGVQAPIYNGTICMDSRHEASKHYNIHGLHSHYMIDETAKTLDRLLHNRTLLMSRHAFIGTGKHSVKWLGEYGSRWEDFRKSIIATFDMTMFGFSMSGADVCGFSGEIQMDVCENWIKAGGMSPMMKLIVDDGTIDDVFKSFLLFLKIEY
jgi:alpha-glucosidase (family GH31 glycosyl hydrolase)